ncbi:MAG: hypothetical protein JWO82_4300, partial [Akkermansiaceae bacterium]|nr:hypothetical protein [Akkermansiaceae bacterium]
MSTASLTAAIIEEEARIERELYEQIRETYLTRDAGPAEFAIWAQTCKHFHQRPSPLDRLWEDDYLVLLRGGDRSAVLDAVAFLEVDPWYHRSGYLKEKLIKALKRAPLQEGDRQRLRETLLRIVTGKNRRELRQFCTLAGRVTDAGFEQRLTACAG